MEQNFITCRKHFKTFQNYNEKYRYHSLYVYDVKWDHQRKTVLRFPMSSMALLPIDEYRLQVTKVGTGLGLTARHAWAHPLNL